MLIETILKMPCSSQVRILKSGVFCFSHSFQIIIFIIKRSLKHLQPASTLKKTNKHRDPRIPSVQLSLGQANQRTKWYAKYVEGDLLWNPGRKVMWRWGSASEPDVVACRLPVPPSPPRRRHIPKHFQCFVRRPSRSRCPRCQISGFSVELPDFGIFHSDAKQTMSSVCTLE